MSLAVLPTPVKKIGALGASLDIGEAPTRRALPAAAELRLDALVARLAATSGKRILLMLDEIQALGDVPEGDKIIATLRAVLHKRREILSAVFTGSSQENMTRMLSTAGAPMYQFAQLWTFRSWATSSCSSWLTTSPGSTRARLWHLPIYAERSCASASNPDSCEISSSRSRLRASPTSTPA